MIALIYTFPDDVITDDSEPDLCKLVFDTIAPFMAPELVTTSHLDARWISNVNGGSANAGAAVALTLSVSPVVPWPCGVACGVCVSRACTINPACITHRAQRPSYTYCLPLEDPDHDSVDGKDGIR